MTSRQTGKIGIYFPTLHGGGAERAMLNLAGGIRDKGFDVEIILVSAEGPYKKFVPNGVKIIDLMSSGVIASLPRLCNHIKKSNLQAILSTPVHANIALILAKKLTGVSSKVIIREAITPSQTGFYSKKKKTSNLILFLMKMLYPHANGIIAVSAGVANDLSSLIGMPREKINVVYNPVVTKEMLLQADEPIDHPWLMEKDLPVIITAGRMTHQKDHDTLIKAFSIAHKSIKSRLIILGEGSEKDNLINLVKKLGLQDFVDFPGFVENPFCYMKNSSLFVLSSKFEGLPNSLIQAMLLGVPVVSTDCPSGPREILQNGRFGVLVPIKDVQKMADAIIWSLNNKTKNDIYDRTEFDLEYSTDVYLKILLEQG